MLQVGERFPEILGRDQNGQEIKLSDFKGKKLVLYFYPKDNTSGCTAEACNLRDNYAALKKAGYEVECILKGLGEYPAVRQIYVKHALEA